MAVYEEWLALKPEIKSKWNIAAPYGRSGVWAYEHYKGEIPGEEQRIKDRNSLSPALGKKKGVGKDGIYVGVDRTGSTAVVRGTGRLKKPAKKSNRK